MAFKEKTQVQSPIVHLTAAEGTTVTGVLTQISTIPTKAGASTVARLRLIEPGTYEVYDGTDKSEQVFAAGDHVTVFLTAGLNLELEDVGYPVRVIYTGRRTNPKTSREYHSYQVFVDKDDLVSF